MELGKGLEHGHSFVNVAGGDQQGTSLDEQLDKKLFSALQWLMAKINV